MKPLHVDEEQIERLVHGERVDPTIFAHVESCPACKARLDDARRAEESVLGLLRHGDHAAPPVTADTVIARARAQRFGWGRWAAAIALTLGVAGVAYAAPGSPLRDWIAGLTREEDTARPVAQPPEPDAGGLYAAPGSHFTIVFVPSAGPGRAMVSLTDSAQIVARSTDPAMSFTSETDDRMAIDTRGSASDVEIRIPRGAPRVEIRVGDRRVLLKSGTDIITDAPRDAATGRYLVPLRTK